MTLANVSPPLIHLHGGLGSVAVRALELTRGTVFQVHAEWKTPTAVKHDYYDASTLELARAIANRTWKALSGYEEPDLRAIAADLKRRDHALQTLKRDAEGAAVMGDTAPDEAA